MTELRRFESRDEASASVATDIAASLEQRLDSDDLANVVVSGGTTPLECFRLLGDKALDWASVRIVLSDERWVDSDHESSNERMVRETLLHGAAGAASLLPVFAVGKSTDERCIELGDTLSGSHFATTLLGMGSDGHFASLFPDADQLAAGLDLSSDADYIAVTTAASPFERVSMTLAALLRSDVVRLLCFGDDKLAVIETARADHNAYPVSHLLHQNQTPVQIYWAP